MGIWSQLGEFQEVLSLVNGLSMFLAGWKTTLSVKKIQNVFYFCVGTR